jgi:hypothetical protein
MTFGLGKAGGATVRHQQSARAHQTCNGRKGATMPSWVAGHDEAPKGISEPAPAITRDAPPLGSEHGAIPQDAEAAV